MIDIDIDPWPEITVLADLWRRAWGSEAPPTLARMLEQSLLHVGAFDGSKLVGFVNVVWDGGQHAFILDTQVDPDYRRQSIGTLLVRAAAKGARERGAEWLHVDYEPHLETFYRACGFVPSRAGVMRL